MDQSKDLRFKVQTISAILLLLCVLSLVSYMIEMVEEIRTWSESNSVANVRISLIILIQIPSAMILSSGSRTNWTLGITVATANALYQLFYWLQTIYINGFIENNPYEISRVILALSMIAIYCLRPVRDLCLRRSHYVMRTRVERTALLTITVSALIYLLTFFIPAFYNPFDGVTYTLFTYFLPQDTLDLTTMGSMIVLAAMICGALMFIALLCVASRRVFSDDIGVSLLFLIPSIELMSMSYLIANIFIPLGTHLRYGIFLNLLFSTVALASAAALMVNLYCSERTLSKEHADRTVSEHTDRCMPPGR